MNPNDAIQRTISLLLTAALLRLAGGCVLVHPTYLPAPVESIELPGGTSERRYDTDGDGVVDYREQLSREHRVVRLLYDTDEDGVIDCDVPFDRRGSSHHPVHGSADPTARPIPWTAHRRLLIILDSIPFDMVARARDRGLFAHFLAPTRVISPYPVMTDLSLDEFFGVSPAPAVETDYYDGHRSVDGWGPYARAANSRWLGSVDYHVPFARHGDIYLAPRAGFERELAGVERLVARKSPPPVTAYMVAPSALGFVQGRPGHAWGLERLDRFCRALIHRYRGAIDITLMSDHGHQFAVSRRIGLAGDLARRGYHVTDRLKQPGDVVIPRFGLVSTVAIHTRQAERVARDVAQLAYVELAACRGDDGAIDVFAHDRQHATIIRRGDRYRYAPTKGDPLFLSGVVDELASTGRLDAEGFAADTDWFTATTGATYPDALYRLHRAFGGLVVHVPDVLVSLRSGWCSGSPLMSGFVTTPRAIHGSLNADSTTGFAMTTVGPLPAAVRMIDLADALTAAGWEMARPTDRDRTTPTPYEQQSTAYRGLGNGAPVR